MQGQTNAIVVNKILQPNVNTQQCEQQFFLDRIEREGDFLTFTRYFWVVDEQLNKKGLRCV